MLLRLIKVYSIEDLGLESSVHDLARLEDTVFASRQNDVDRLAVVKLVRISMGQNP